MKSVQVELPENFARELDMRVQQGWFRGEEKAMRFAWLELLRRHRLGLLEQFQTVPTVAPEPWRPSITMVLAQEVNVMQVVHLSGV